MSLALFPVSLPSPAPPCVHLFLPQALLFSLLPFTDEMVEAKGQTTQSLEEPSPHLPTALSNSLSPALAEGEGGWQGKLRP